MKAKQRSGQTLVAVLVFVAMAVVVASAAAVLMITGAQGGVEWEAGNAASTVAESGAEEAILRLLRDPNYTGGTLTTAAGTATITVSGTDPKTIDVEGLADGHARHLRVVVGYTDKMLTVQSWREIP